MLDIGQRIRMGICPEETGTIIDINHANGRTTYTVCWDRDRLTWAGY